MKNITAENTVTDNLLTPFPRNNVQTLTWRTPSLFFRNTHQAFRSEQAAAWASPYRLFGAQTATRSLWTTLVCSSAMCSWCVGATGRSVKRSVTVHASLTLLEQWSTFAVNWFTNRSELILETLKQKGFEGPNNVLCLFPRSSELPSLLRVM